MQQPSRLIESISFAAIAIVAVLICLTAAWWTLRGIEALVGLLSL